MISGILTLTAGKGPRNLTNMVVRAGGGSNSSQRGSGRGNSRGGSWGGRGGTRRPDHANVYVFERYQTVKNPKWNFDPLFLDFLT